jgi:hypothetical protein
MFLSPGSRARPRIFKPVTGIFPQGRLTLTSGTAITTTDVTGATQFYYTPGVLGNQIPIFNGISMVPVTFKELTQLNTDTTKSPAAVANTSVYDIFAWLDGSTVRATRGPAWSSDTSRGTGAGTSQIQQVAGIWTNQFAITNGPAANRGTLLGSVRSDGSAQLKDTVAFRWVSNAYNSVLRQMLVTEATASWTYSTATFRQANANTANQLDILQTLAGQPLNAFVISTYSNTTTAVFGSVGIDIDTINTSAIVNNIVNTNQVPVTTSLVTVNAQYNGYPGLGRHAAIWKEWSQQATGTFYGTAGGTVIQSGIYGSIFN